MDRVSSAWLPLATTFDRYNPVTMRLQALAFSIPAALSILLYGHAEARSDRRFEVVLDQVETEQYQGFGTPAMNDSGDIVFIGERDGAPDQIVRLRGGLIEVLYDPATSAEEPTCSEAMRLADNGDVLFMVAGGTPSVTNWDESLGAHQPVANSSILTTFLGVSAWLLGWDMNDQGGITLLAGASSRTWLLRDDGGLLSIVEEADWSGPGPLLSISYPAIDDDGSIYARLSYFSGPAELVRFFPSGQQEVLAIPQGGRPIHVLNAKAGHVVYLDVGYPYLRVRHRSPVGVFRTVASLGCGQEYRSLDPYWLLSSLNASRPGGSFLISPRSCLPAHLLAGEQPCLSVMVWSAPRRRTLGWESTRAQAPVPWSGAPGSLRWGASFKGRRSPSRAGTGIPSPTRVGVGTT
jgi:hypothetical protein